MSKLMKNKTISRQLRKNKKGKKKNLNNNISMLMKIKKLQNREKLIRKYKQDND